MHRQAMPWLKLKNNQAIDLYFEFLDPESIHKFYLDLVNGKTIKVPNFGGGISNVTETLKWDDLAKVEQEKVKNLIKSMPKNPKIKYDTESQSFQKVVKAHSVINSFLKLAGYDREQLAPGYVGKFVIHRHAADRAGLHFDLRLEFPVKSLHEALGTYEGKRLPGTPEPLSEFPDKPGTVYRSFAVRKHSIPTENTKLFIVETEDHPISYGGFSGKISEGYGAGDVDIYDHGTFKLIDVKGDRKYTMEFKGKELRGVYTFVKYKNGYLWLKNKEEK